MKQLSINMRGPEIQSLKVWLTAFGAINADSNVFDEATKKLVQQAQRNYGLVADGVVGPRTTAAFLQAGWLPPGYEQPSAPTSPYPYVPTDYKPLGQNQKTAAFGSPGKVSDNPTPGGDIGGKPAFKLQSLDLRKWFPNIGSPAAPIHTISLNVAVVLQWTALFDEIVKLGLQDKLLSCSGSYSPRYVRGSIITFSSHAFGTAVDFNAPQNWLGAAPARVGEKGSLVEIVRLLHKYKMWSGMWFTRVDGMHIESTQTDKQLGLPA